jgi:RND superfamily putative drug exporter
MVRRRRSYHGFAMSARPPRFGRAVVALRWPIVLFWVAAAVAATTLLPSIEESQTGALGALVPSHADALDAELRSAELFGFPLLSRTIVVQRDPDGLPASAQTSTVSRAVALNRDALPDLNRIGGALPVLNTLSLPPFTREQGTTAITYLYFRPEVGSGERLDLAQRLRALADASHPRAFSGVTGALAAREAQSRTISGRLPLVELLTLLVVVTAVGLHYRALLAPIVTVGAVAVTYLVAVRVVASAGERFGVSVPSEVQPVLVVLLFGILTDYAIFFLSRFRLRLSEGESAHGAARRATDELLSTVVAAGVTVAAASAALIVAELGFFKTFGPGLAGAVLIGLAVAVTLIPALLAILGESTFWPSRPGRDVPAAIAAEEQPAERAARPVRSRALRLASARPGLTALLCGLVLLVAASGLLQLRVGQTLIRGLPWGSETHQAYVQASRGFAPGVLSPTTVLVEAPGIVDRRVALVRLQRSIGRLPGVALIVGPAEQPLATELGAVYSRSRNAVRFLIVFDADPLGSRAIRHLRTLRTRLGTLTTAAGLPDARTSIAGDTALAEETVRLTRVDLGRVAPVTLLVVFAVLVVFLRALVAPLYLVGASVLALAASLGITVYVFQDLLGYGELTYYVPFVAAVLLVALGSDYNVFLTGRIWQEARRRPLRAAIALGGSRAASAITVAGLVLALSFAMLALVPVRPFRELAFLMSVGLLIDAFLVRTLLVPSLIALVGPRSAWPSRLRPEPTPGAPVPAPAPTFVAAAEPAGSRGLERVVLAGVAIGIALNALARRR